MTGYFFCAVPNIALSRIMPGLVSTSRKAGSPFGTNRPHERHDESGNRESAAFAACDG